MLPNKSLQGKGLCTYKDTACSTCGGTTAHCLQVQGTLCVCSAEFIVLRFFDNAEDVLPHIVIMGSQEAFKLLCVRHAREVVDGAKSMEIGLPSECVKLDAGTTSARAAVFAVSASYSLHTVQSW